MFHSFQISFVTASRSFIVQSYIISTRSYKSETYF